VAGITVVGTLGTTVLTLLWSARREDWRWRRERQDRHEQDRAAQYAKLVAALHAWYTALTSVRAGQRPGGDPLLGLAVPVLAQRVGERDGEGDRPFAAGCLGFGED
jgi:hypothetical protein